MERAQDPMPVTWPHRQTSVASAMSLPLQRPLQVSEIQHKTSILTLGTKKELNEQQLLY